MYKVLLISLLLCISTTAYGIDCTYNGRALCSDIMEVMANQQKILQNQEKMKKALLLMSTGLQDKVNKKDYDTIKRMLE